MTTHRTRAGDAVALVVASAWGTGGTVGELVLSLHSPCTPSRTGIAGLLLSRRLILILVGSLVSTDVD